jgi:hypothetical protein
MDNPPTSYTRGPLILVYVYMGNHGVAYIHKGPPCIHASARLLSFSYRNSRTTLDSSSLTNIFVMQYNDK